MVHGQRAIDGCRLLRMAETAIERRRVHRGMAISARCTLRIKTDMVPCRDLVRIRIVRVIVTTRTVHQGGIRPGVTHRAITAGCQSRIMVHFQAAVQDRLAGVAHRAGDVDQVNAGVAIGTGSAHCRRRRMMHRRLAVEDRLAGVAGRTIQFGLVNAVTSHAVAGQGRRRRVVTASEDIRVAAGVTIVTFVRCYQRAKIQHIVTGGTVVNTVVRCTVCRAVVHRGITGQRLGCMTGDAIQHIATHAVNAFVTGGTSVIGVGIRRMVTRSLLAGRTSVACFAVIHNSVGASVAIITIRGVNLGCRVVTRGNRCQARISRIDMTSGAIERDNVLVTGGTVGVCPRRGMVHGRRAVEAGNRGLLGMAGRACERGRIDAGVAIRAGRTRCRCDRGVMMHRRAAILARLAAVAGRTLESRLGDVLDPLVTGATIVACRGLGGMVHGRAAFLADNLRRVTALTRSIAWHCQRIIRGIGMTIEATERVCGR